MTKIKPLGNRVLVEQVEGKIQKGGIILPETVEKNKPERGKVIAISLGKLNDKGQMVKPEVKKGDIVLFRKYDADNVTIRSSGVEKELIFIDSDKILAIEE